MENQEYVPAAQADAAADGKRVMILGIVAAALSVLGVPGIILAAITLKKAKQWREAYGRYLAMPRVGHILGVVALPTSIVMACYWLFLCLWFGLLIWILLHTSDLPNNVDLSRFPELAFLLA